MSRLRDRMILALRSWTDFKTGVVTINAINLLDMIDRLAEPTAEHRFTLGKTSTIYMNGHAVYRVRRKGLPGIIHSIDLLPAEAESLIEKGVFDRYERD